MTVVTDDGKICVVRDGWITCPACRRNRRLLRIREDTEAKNLQVFCRMCRSEIIVDIRRGESV